MPTPLLNGEVEYLEENLENAPDLGNEVADLQARLDTVEEELAVIKNVLRRQAAAFQQSFGDVPIPAGDGQQKWEAIKLRLAPRLREAVDILLLQGQMKRTQIASALKMDYSNCTKNIIGALKAQGWLVESGGYLSLKQL